MPFIAIIIALIAIAIAIVPAIVILARPRAEEGRGADVKLPTGSGTPIARTSDLVGAGHVESTTR